MTLYPSIHVCQFVLQWLAAGTGEPGPHFGKHQSAEIEMSDAFNADAYLDRIGLTRPITVNIEGLCQLQYAHLMRVPFENLDIHLGRPIRLDLASFFEKIVIRRRGGFCYELNGLFAVEDEGLDRVGARAPPAARAARGLKTKPSSSWPKK